VVGVQPMMHRFAFVGNDLQDMFGINPARIQTATSVSDAFFQGENAKSVLAALAARPDASSYPTRLCVTTSSPPAG
jgi:putative ABC transport system permease protein